MSEGKKRQTDGRGGPNKKHRPYWSKAPSSDKAIPMGSVGILVTCDSGRERRALEEVTTLLDEAFQRLGHVPPTKAPAGKPQQQQQQQGQQQDKQQEQPAESGQEVGAFAAPAPQSVDALLAAEVAALKDKKKRRFQMHDTGVKGTFFLVFPDEEGCPSPCAAVTSILQHVKDTRLVPARYVLRLLPIMQSCFVSMDEIQALGKKIAEQEFPEGDGVVPIEFAVELEHRACNTLDRLDVVNAFAEPVPKPPHKVNLTKPHKTILVQLIRNVCGVCVIDCYKELSKLNVRKAAEDAQEEAVNKAVTAAASGNDTQAAGCTKQQQQQPAVDQQQQEQQQEGSTQPAE
eukprot:jgi/Chrzof1/13321/Cz07g28250.t1